ncbi:MAG: hypothetical protein ACJAZ2_001325 [Glaciecola sp.]|jgi:hypothetical protein
MAKLTLEIEFEFDFHLLGISCHLPDYRLAWIINNKLGIDLERKEDLDLFLGRKKEENGMFSFFQYDNIENYTTINLIANRSEKGYFCGELKQLDYFIQLWLPESDRDELATISNKLKKSPQVNAVIDIEVETLKSKNNFIL